MPNENIKEIHPNKYVALIDGKEIPIIIENRSVERLIAKGANGAAFLCLNELLNKREVVKVWLPKKADAIPDKDRFLKEVRQLARINHNNIVTVHHAWVENGLFLCSMEYIDGITLREWLKGNVVVKGHDGNKPRKIHVSTTLKSTLYVMDQLFTAITDYQAAGLVHGDIHGNNILIDHENTVHIIDFGSPILHGKQRDRSIDLEIYHTWELIKEAFDVHNKPSEGISPFNDITFGDITLNFFGKDTILTVDAPKREKNNSTYIDYKDWSVSLLLYVKLLKIVFEAKGFYTFFTFKDYCDYLAAARYLNVQYFLGLVKENSPEEYDRWSKVYIQMLHDDYMITSSNTGDILPELLEKFRAYILEN